jgi:glycolate oxidase FAD binding subunit
MFMQASCLSRICRASSRDMSLFKVSGDKELVQLLAWAAGEQQTLEICSTGVSTYFGRPVNAQHQLDVSGLNGIVDYQPEELVLTVKAATALSEIEAALWQQQQSLAFEPPRFAQLLGLDTDANTIGGMVSCGLAGPRRFKVGSVRDFVLGMAAVSGRGEAFVCGGKVIKNVTGYDLPKLLTGSYGTLAVLHEVTLKTLPTPQTQCTVLIKNLEVAAAVALMNSVLRTDVDLSGASFLPANLDFPARPYSCPLVALRLEGFTASVSSRVDLLRTYLDLNTQIQLLDTAASAPLWAAIRDVQPFATTARQGVVWRVAVPAAAAAAFLGTLSSTLQFQYYLDWAGGLIWMQLASSEEPHAEALRRVLQSCGGYATLIRASRAVRAATAVFQPQSAPLAALTQRIKQQFDPRGILNPGRMYPGV